MQFTYRITGKFGGIVLIGDLILDGQIKNRQIKSFLVVNRQIILVDATSVL